MPPRDWDNVLKDILFKDLDDKLVPVNGIPELSSATKEKKLKDMTPTKIIRSGNTTIVFWGDGDKTIVRRMDSDPDDPYAAFTAAFAIRAFGSNARIKRIVKDLTVEQKPKAKKPAVGDGDE